MLRKAVCRLPELPSDLSETFGGADLRGKDAVRLALEAMKDVGTSQLSYVVDLNNGGVSGAEDCHQSLV